MIGGMTSLFLREIPPSLSAGVKAGTHKVWGSTIREVATGRIAGFLQETRGLPDVLTRLANPLQGSAGLAGQAVTIVQNEQIKAAVSMVQTLQIADLVMSGVGVGATLAGTAVLARRIKRLEDAVGTMG